MIVEDSIRYCDTPGNRQLNLLKEGIECIPVLGLSNFKSVQQGPELHFHSGCMEFNLCLKGDLTFETPTGIWPFRPGTVFASAPRQPHHLKDNPSGLLVYRILFRIPSPGTSILGLDRRSSEWIVRSLTHLPRRSFAATPEIKESFETLFRTYDETKTNAPSRRVRLISASLRLLLSLIDAARRTTPRSPSTIETLVEKIRTQPYEDYSLPRLAVSCGLSRATFFALFKKETGLPPHAFLLNCRIEEARRLLAETAKPVSAIAQELHFYSSQHFTTTFKRIVGQTPAEFRTHEKQRPGGTAADRSTRVSPGRRDGPSAPDCPDRGAAANRCRP